MTEPDLSVVIVTWNVRPLVEVCIRRVLERSEGIRLEIIVVDNASSDGTVEALRALLPDVRVLSSGANVGFPRANNLALEHTRGRYVLFLNPDTEVGPGTLSRCVRELDAHPELGAVGCRLEYADGKTQVEGGRRHYRLRHLLFEAFYLHALFPRHPVFAHQTMGEWDHRGVRDVEALCGAFLVVRREALLDVGGLPDEVFMYHEDLALCLRLEGRGWRLRYLGDVSTLHHAGAAVAGSASPLELLEGEVRVRLIREREGLIVGVAARILFAVREVARLLIGASVAAIPAVRTRYPQVVALQKHATLLLWTLWPGAVRRALARSGVHPDERVRVLVVGPTPPPIHGTSLYVRALVTSMASRNRFRLTHVDLADRRSLDNLGRWDARNVLLGLGHAAQVAAAVLRERPDVAYVPISQNTAAFVRDSVFLGLARLGGARSIIHLHGGRFRAFYRGASAPTRWLVRSSLGGVWRCWVLGEPLREEFAGLVAAGRVRVVPNGVPEPFAAAAPTDDGAAGSSATRSGTLRVLSLGQLSRAKGTDVLLASVSRLVLDGQDVRAIFAGEWATDEDRRQLGPVLRDLVSRGRAELRGLVSGDAKQDALRDADVLVLASTHEGQPLAILEAMASSLPVVATPRGAIPDAVQHGETGFLIDGLDAESLTAALARTLGILASDPELRRRMGRAARTRYEARFTQRRALARALDEIEEAGRPLKE